MSTEPVLTQHKVTVLLVDDQPMIGEAVRRMLAGEPDIIFHYNRDAGKALDEADRRLERACSGRGDRLPMRNADRAVRRVVVARAVIPRRPAEARAVVPRRLFEEECR